MQPSRFICLAAVAMLWQPVIAMAADAPGGGDTLVAAPGSASPANVPVVVRGTRPVSAEAAAAPGMPSPQAASERRLMPPPSYGVPAAPLVSRQIWWVVAALATAAALALIVFRRSVPAAIAGLLLIMLPHFIGAPELEHVETNVPSSLSHQFVVAVTLTSLVFWSTLGALTSAVFAYFERDALERRQLHA